MNRIGLISIGILVALCVFFFAMWRGASGEKERLQANQNALLEKNEFYRTEAEHNAASVEALTLSKREIEKYNADLVKTCDELNVSLRRMISASVSGIRSDYHIEGELREKSVTVHDTAQTMKCMDYDSPHLSFSACVDSSSFVVADIVTRDTINSIVHGVPHKFLFFKWGIKEVRQEVFSTNPNTHIVYTQLIEKE